MIHPQTEAVKWTAEEFTQKVLGRNPKIAVFDCDGTLWGGDSGYGFMVWSLERGLVSRSSCDWIDERYRLYLAGSIPEDVICGEMVQIYAGLRDQELRSAAAEYVRKFVKDKVYAEMEALVAALRESGAELWAVSSTNRWVVAEGVRDFGIPEERVLAAAVHLENGLITSKLADVPTGPGKAAALKRAGLVYPDAVFGNSVHDLAMLEIARDAYPVNPSPALLEAASQHGWGYFSPASSEGVSTVVNGE